MTTVQTKPYTPAQFTRFGRYPKDLFKKKFEYQHTLRTISRNRSGLALESGAILQDSGDLSGYVKSTLPRFSWGLVTAELQTDASQDSKVTVALDGLPKGLTISPTFSSKDKNFKKPLAGLEVAYQQEYFATSLTAKSDLENHKVDASLAVGDAGISVGGAVSVDMSSGADIQEMNFGVEYEQDDYTASIYTENNASTVTAAYYQRLTPNHALAAHFKYALGGSNAARSLTVGSEYRVAADTVVKAKLDVPSGDVAAHVEHRLVNPRVLLGIATTFNARAAKFAAEKVGVNVTLGDF